MRAPVDAGIVAEGITKLYGQHLALDDVSMEVAPGSVTALLGPNGAGKTTLVRVLTTLIRPDRGHARVAGHDVVAQPEQVRRSIGLVGQHVSVDDYLTGRENLILVARLLRFERAGLHEQIDRTLETFGLTDLADREVATYSLGLRRRLDIAVTLLSEPAVIFLDEPTTGLDPASRREVWSLVQQLVAGGTTVLLTTQYLEEADQLADLVAVIDQGRMIANGTPGELKARLGDETVEIRLADPTRAAEAVSVLRPLIATCEPVGSRSVAVSAADPSEEGVLARGPDGAALLPEVLRHLDSRGIRVAAVEIRRPDLDDVFLALTGQRPNPDADHPDAATNDLDGGHHRRQHGTRSHK